MGLYFLCGPFRKIIWDFFNFRKEIDFETLRKVFIAALILIKAKIVKTIINNNIIMMTMIIIINITIIIKILVIKNY